MVIVTWNFMWTPAKNNNVAACCSWTNIHYFWKCMFSSSASLSFKRACDEPNIRLRCTLMKTLTKRNVIASTKVSYSYEAKAGLPASQFILISITVFMNLFIREFSIWPCARYCQISETLFKCQFYMFWQVE